MSLMIASSEDDEGRTATAANLAAALASPASASRSCLLICENLESTFTFGHRQKLFA